MKSKSAPGSSTRTSRRTDRLFDRLLIAIVVILIPVAGFYVIEAFVAPNPFVRIALRSLPVLPLAIWTLWFDRSRPFARQPPAIQLAGRVALLLIAMTFAVALLGLALDRLYNPDRVI
jgi:drug/metabolite transporter (DMT)-like permease